jgi:hypothetical protein
VAGRGEGLGYRDHVGFNPFRAQQRRSTDYVVVAVAMVVIAALVLWALFG